MPFLFSILALNLVITIKWQFRTDAWFRTTIVIFAAVHGLLIFYPPFQGPDDKENIRAYAGLGGIDMIVMLAILSFIHKSVGAVAAVEHSEASKEDK